jgi:hypothetical protein
MATKSAFALGSHLSLGNQPPNRLRVLGAAGAGMQVDQSKEHFPLTVELLYDKSRWHGWILILNQIIIGILVNQF